MGKGHCTIHALNYTEGFDKLHRGSVDSLAPFSVRGEERERDRLMDTDETKF